MASLCLGTSWTLVLAVSVALSVLSFAHAQEPAATPADGPPRARVIPPVTWPAGEPVPDGGSVEALIVVGRDGLGQLEECAASETVCDGLRAALFEASFEPARVGGQAVPSRVRVRFAVSAPVAAAPSAPQSATPAGSATATTAVPAADGRLPLADEPALPLDDGASDYGAVAAVERTRPTARALELAEMREVPGAFGDPFRVIDTMPGVVPLFTGLPYVFVRGAPPSATVYFYDGIPMPALFHLGLGPAVVHPAMVGPIDFFAGVAPARYGRKTGGVVAGKAALRPLKPGVHGELELRLIDLQAYVAKPLGRGGRVEVAARYGYPGLLLKFFSPETVFQYWDYQMRSKVRLSRHAEAQLVVLGSYDLVGTREGLTVTRNLELQFHRIEARLVERRDAFTLTSALVAGFERSGLGDNLDVEAYRIGPKVWIEAPIGRLSLRVGADMLATSGKIITSDGEPGSTFSPSAFLPAASQGGAKNVGNNAIAPPDAVAATATAASSQSNVERPQLRLSNDSAYLGAAGRNVIGAYAELLWPLSSRWELEAGLRADTWLTGSRTQSAGEPRAVLRYQPIEPLVLHAAAGLAYQPAVFQIPLPGVSDVAIDQGLQRSIQSEVGGALKLPQSFSVESTTFVHYYTNMVSFERPPEQPPCDPNADDCPEPKTFSRFSALSYGTELLVRRAYKELVSGWLSYTLSKATGTYEDGRTLIPNFDVRHVGNLVLQWRITENWHVAFRGYGQSGRFPLSAATEIDPRKAARLPPFYRGDLQLARLWQRPWGELRFTFDWLNATFQRDPFSWDCGTSPLGSSDKCQVEYVPFPITLPMLGVRGTY